jgi:Leucine-rich repeat (LRR) protein
VEILFLTLKINMPGYLKNWQNKKIDDIPLNKCSHEKSLLSLASFQDEYAQGGNILFLKPFGSDNTSFCFTKEDLDGMIEFGNSRGDDKPFNIYTNHSFSEDEIKIINRFLSEETEGVLNLSEYSFDEIGQAEYIPLSDQLKSINLGDYNKIIVNQEWLYLDGLGIDNETVSKFIPEEGAKAKHLHLYENNLSSLSNLSRRFADVEYIDCDKNKFNKIDEDLEMFPNLKILSLYRNQISSLEKLISPSLKDLRLGFNELKRVEMGVTGRDIDNIESLDIMKNKIEYADLTYFQKLETLYIHGNKLKKLDNLKISKKELKILYIDDNNITFLDEHFLRQLRNLEELHISFNKITNLRSINFGKILPKLETLGISKDQKKSIINSTNFTVEIKEYDELFEY